MRISRLKPLPTREKMTAYKRAINYVLSQTPVSESPVFAQYFPEAENMLAALTAYEETLDYFHPLRQTRRDVIQYVRTHPDIQGFQAVFGVSDEWIDQFFIKAMQFEGTA